MFEGGRGRPVSVCAWAREGLQSRRCVLQRNQQEKHAGKGGDGRQAGMKR
jgi:hypothetical protein